MKIIKKHGLVANEDYETFKEDLTQRIEELQNEGYELDIKFSTALGEDDKYVLSAMILCY